MKKSFRLLFSSLAVLMILLSCSLSVMAYEPWETDPTADWYPDDMPVFLIDTGIVITSQPVDAVGQLGDIVKFSVKVSGEVTSYQWQYSDGYGWYDNSDPGANTATVSVEVRDYRNGYRYRCIISNSLGYVVSDAATLTIGDPPATEPIIPDTPVIDNNFTIGDILGLLNTGATAVVSWFSSIMDSTGAGTVYIAMMSVVLCVGILLGPLLGSARAGLDAGSDKAAHWIKTHSADRKHTTSHLEKTAYKNRK